MNQRIEQLGTPDLKVSVFQIWVHGRQFPDSDDYYDGNWLLVTAHCGGSGATVIASGALVMVTDFAHFGEACARLHSGKVAFAAFDPLEPELKLELKATDKLGHINACVEITPDHLAQYHSFSFDIDQSYLPGIASQCAEIVAQYPIRGIESGAGA